LSEQSLFSLTETDGAVPENGNDGQLTWHPTLQSEAGIESIVRDRPSGKVSGKKLLALLELQGRCCALSGIELTPQTVSLDHIVPLAEGGADDMGNVQLVHAIINSMKGLMSQTDFVKWCKLVSDRHS
jgi:5-methylcytosine-specific restriction endonuclease McrA